MPVTFVDGAGFQALHPGLDARSRLSGYRVPAGLDRLHVHSQFTLQSDAEISGAACDLRRTGACDQGFRWNAASVDAGPPNKFRSITAIFMPASTKRAASGGPAYPVPMMIASYFCMS